MFRSFLLVFFISVASLGYGQGYGLDWAFNPIDTLENGGQVECLAQKVDLNGNVILAGTFNYSADFDFSSAETELTSSGESPDIFLAKYDSLGNLLWAKSFGGRGIDKLHSIDLDSVGNIVLVGDYNYRFNYDAADDSVYLTSSVTGSMYRWHSFILKYSSGGDFMWVRDIGSTYIVNSTEVHVGKSGDLLITGHFYSSVCFESPNYTDTLFSQGLSDIFLAKFDGSGGYLWAISMGSYEEDLGIGVSTDSIGNVYLIASIFDTVDIDPSANIFNVEGTNGFTPTYSSIMVRYTPAGALDWGYSFPDLYGFANLNDILLDVNGEILVTGDYQNSPGYFIDFDQSPAVGNITTTLTGTGAFVAKYGSNGQYYWAQNVNPIKASGKLITQGMDGSIYILGNKEDFGGQLDMFMVKCDTLGNTLSYDFYQGNDDNIPTGLSISPTNHPVASGSFFGATNFSPSPGVFVLSAPNPYSTGFVIYYDTTGFVIWGDKLGNNAQFGSGPGQFDDEGAFITEDNSDNIYTAGSFKGQTDFDPSANEAILAATNSGAFYDFSSYIAKYSSLGDYQWAFKLDSATINDNLVIDSLTNLYAGGNILGTVDFDPSPGISSLTTPNLSGFIAKYDSSSNLLWAYSIDQITISSYSMVKSIALDSANNILVLGNFYGTVDFDFGAGVSSLTSATGQMFMAKYTPNGLLLWTHLIEVQGAFSKNMDVNRKGEIFLTGDFEFTADLDPSLGVYNLTSEGLRDVFVAKYDSLANFQWAFNLGSSSNDYANEIIAGADHIYISGKFADSLDLDPSLAEMKVFSGGEATYLARYESSTGVFNWGFNIGETMWETVAPFSIDLDEEENIGLTGVFQTVSGGAVWNNVDFDPSAGIAEYHSQNIPGEFSASPFIAVYDSIGNYRWATDIPSYAYSTGIGAIHFSNDNELLLTGVFENYADLAPFGAVNNLESFNGSDAFVAKYFECQIPNVFDTIQTCDTYTWTNGIIYDTTGVYLDTVVTSEGCQFVKQLNLTILAFDTTVILLNDTTLQAMPGASYQWIDCNTMNAIPGAINQEFSSALPDYFAVIVDNGMCIDTSYCHYTGCDVSNVFDTVVTCYPYTWINGMTYSATGNYLVNLSTPGGCPYVSQLNLTVNVLDTTVVEINDTTLQAPAGLSYQWLECPSLNPILGASSQQFTPSIPGYYAVVVNNGTCSETSSCYYTGCPPDIFEVVETCDPYTWTNGITYQSTGIYAETLYAPGGCAYTSELDLTVTEIDTAVTIMNDTTLQAVAGISYQWIDCGTMNPILGETNQFFFSNIIGSYAVVLTNGACSDTSACQIIGTIGLETNTLEYGIMLYPNPTTGEVNLSFTENQGDLCLRIMDVFGKIISSECFYETDSIIVQLPATPGCYYLELTNSESESTHFRVIKM